MVIPSSAFESGRGKFVSTLRQAFGGGTFFIFGECTNKDVIEFYKWLKDQYEEAGDYASLEEIYHLGYQGEGYWVLSDHVSIFTMSIQSIRDSFCIFSVFNLYLQLCFPFF